MAFSHWRSSYRLIHALVRLCNGGIPVLAKPERLFELLGVRIIVALAIVACKYLAADVPFLGNAAEL